MFKKKKNPIYIDYSERKKDDKISKDVTIYILTCVILILVFYLISMRIIVNRNHEIQEYYTVFSTEIIEAESTNNALININSDNIYELMQIPGIGKSKAEAIIEYRKENGNFTRLDELMNISGIGENTFNKLKPYIYIENTSENSTENQ